MMSDHRAPSFRENELGEEPTALNEELWAKGGAETTKKSGDENQIPTGTNSVGDFMQFVNLQLGSFQLSDNFYDADSMINSASMMEEESDSDHMAVEERDENIKYEEELGKMDDEDRILSTDGADDLIAMHVADQQDEELQVECTSIDDPIPTVEEEGGAAPPAAAQIKKMSILKEELLILAELNKNENADQIFSDDRVQKIVSEAAEGLVSQKNLTDATVGLVLDTSPSFQGGEGIFVDDPKVAENDPSDRLGVADLEIAISSRSFGDASALTSFIFTSPSNASTSTSVSNKFVTMQSKPMTSQTKKKEMSLRYSNPDEELADSKSKEQLSVVNAQEENNDGDQDSNESNAELMFMDSEEADVTSSPVASEKKTDTEEQVPGHKIYTLSEEDVSEEEGDTAPFGSTGSCTPKVSTLATKLMITQAKLMTAQTKKKAGSVSSQAKLIAIQAKKNANAAEKVQGQQMCMRSKQRVNASKENLEDAKIELAKLKSLKKGKLATLKELKKESAEMGRNDTPEMRRKGETKGTISERFRKARRRAAAAKDQVVRHLQLALARDDQTQSFEDTVFSIYSGASTISTKSTVDISKREAALSNAQAVEDLQLAHAMIDQAHFQRALVRLDQVGVKEDMDCNLTTSKRSLKFSFRNKRSGVGGLFRKNKFQKENRYDNSTISQGVREKYDVREGIDSAIDHTKITTRASRRQQSQQILAPQQKLSGGAGVSVPRFLACADDGDGVKNMNATPVGLWTRLEWYTAGDVAEDEPLCFDCGGWYNLYCDDSSTYRCVRE